MKFTQNKQDQQENLRRLCVEGAVDYDSLISLLESAKTKKLYKRNNYHLQKVNDEIEKALK